MVITSFVKRLRQYCRCICIWQCCTTFQDFDPDFNGRSESQSRAITPQKHHADQTYFNFVKGPPTSATKSETSESSTSSKAKSVNVKIDELEYLLNKS